MAQPSVDPSVPLPDGPSDRHLRAFVAARSRGDRTAMSTSWQELILEEWPRMLVMISAKRHDALPGGKVPVEDRDDVAQRAFERLHDWLKLEGSSIGEVRAIIRQAVHWSVMDHMREHVADDVHRAGSLDDVDDTGEAPAVFVRRIEEELADRLADPFETSAVGTEVSAALADLPENRRRIVVLRLCGYSAKEIAATLGLQPANVDQLHSRGLRQLRQALEDVR